WHLPSNCESLPATQQQQPPSQQQPAPEEPARRVRARVTWDSGSDVDLHTWDPEGNHAYFADQEAIPSGVLVENVIPGFGPEQFETFSGPGGHYTFGICLFDDNDEPSATVTVEVYDPSGQTRTFTKELVYDKDAWLVTISPDRAGFVPDPGWCDRSASSTDPAEIGLVTGDGSEARA
ncbi:MAG: hypothetical protein JWO02_224, partial [Solirubrobacterales bacterium]|nr:hypothetical protein [Solirubrobacterales bacterium]